jgi:hypothetical protein
MASFKRIADYTDKASGANPAFPRKLIIQVSRQNFQYCILEGNPGRFIAMEDYLINETEENGHGGLGNYQPLQDLMGQLDMTKQAFDSVHVIAEEPCSTLVPYPLFDDEKKENYLEFSHELFSPRVILADHLKNIESVNVFAIPEGLHGLLNSTFPGCRISHLTSSLIEGLLANFRYNELQGRVFANVRKEFLDILVFGPEKLIFCNSFQYNCREDFIYFLLFAMEQLKLDPDKVQVVFMGNIRRNSPEYELTYKYVRNPGFIDRNDRLKYSYVFDDLPPHFYYNLFNMELCEL